uniref:Interleukin-22 receptor subunit alpha-1 n=1 Tax=Callorhinchus milii TaxID=7868 RepID=V9KQD1_CALMI
MWPCWIIILSLYMAGSSTHGIESATNVIFQSVNFKNILIWYQKGNFSPGAVYDVQYKIYGDELWKNKTECQHITACECDLTNETEKDIEWFYARVISNRTNSTWSLSERFCPFENTTIEAPGIKYKTSARSISISVELPKFPCSRKSSCSIEGKFGTTEYSVKLRRKHSNETQTYRSATREHLKIETLEPETYYCGTVQLLLERNINKKQSKTVEFCFYTLKDVPYNILVVFLFLGTVIISTICCLAYRYVTLGQRLPASLNLGSLLNRNPSTPTLSLVTRSESTEGDYEFQQVISMKDIRHLADPEQNHRCKSVASVNPGKTWVPQPQSSSQQGDFTANHQRANVRHSSPQAVSSVNSSPYCPQLAASLQTTGYASQNGSVPLTQTYGTILTGSPKNSNCLNADMQLDNEGSPLRVASEVYLSNNGVSLAERGFALDLKYVVNNGEQAALLQTVKDETLSQLQTLMPLIESEIPAFQYTRQESQVIGKPTSPSPPATDVLEGWEIQVLMED